MLSSVYELVVAASIYASTVLSTHPFSTQSGQLLSGHPLPDSTITVPIYAENKDGRPTVIVEKTVTIPNGYTYVGHRLDLQEAFPIEGAESSASWIEGPNRIWSIYTQATPDKGQNVKQVLVRATASPGRKNMEIGAKATLLVDLLKVKRAN
ncbi:hypothetical protein ACAW74_27705 [Fibrella sp. WM1]|uniref:Uncharacterized protein n=1 Tax=Spirosoma sordidisoli TaxID=2502893 RepID=A0A4Q2UIT5_9BACT|nr:hypothetical protein [Spirosoma sordidisoli]RYC66669.1 hypothetical protein EQG79_27910 [Spirosoma sordidisoli]